ncbi:MAG: Acg family FMN-binding oxidoreductase [Lacibacter sp.]
MLPQFHALLEAAAAAPSSHNTQPWKFAVEGHYIRISADLQRRLPVADADDHELYISLGAALENLVLAAGAAGFGSNVMYDLQHPTQPGVIVHLYENADIRPDPLAASIGRRHVNRSEYLNEPLPFELLHLLQQSVRPEEADVYIVTDAATREKLGRLTAVACRMQFRNPAFREELGRWVRFSEKEALQTGDGIAVASLGAPAVGAAVGRFVFRYCTHAVSEAIKAAELAEAGPVLAVLSTTNNTPEGWVKLGRSFERLSLCTTRYDLAHAHLNMACEVPEVRKHLKATLQLNGEPLLLLRIGYPKKVLPASQRRPLASMLQNGSTV